jgi:hypothetical protein
MNAYTRHVTRWAASFLILTSIVPSTIGCKSRAVIFSTATQAGIEVSALEGGKQTAHVGYRRAEVVAMPHRRPSNDETLPKPYSVASLYSLDTGSLLLPSRPSGSGGWGELKIRQVFATGLASVGEYTESNLKSDFNKLTGDVAEDSTATCLQSWVNQAPTAQVRKQRREEIRTFLGNPTDPNAVQAFLWEPSAASNRRAFATQKNLCN